MNREQHNAEQMRKADFLLDLPGSDEESRGCPSTCENPREHQRLGYCPEELATELAGRMEEIYGASDTTFWEEIHDSLLDSDKLYETAQAGPDEAEYLLKLRANAEVAALRESVKFAAARIVDYQIKLDRYKTSHSEFHARREGWETQVRESQDEIAALKLDMASAHHAISVMLVNVKDGDGLVFLPNQVSMLRTVLKLLEEK